MDKDTRERAKEMLHRRIVGTGKGQHLPVVYVVGERLFAFEHAANAWRREVCKNRLPLENVSIMEAYDVASRYDLPAHVRVDWSLINYRKI